MMNSQLWLGNVRNLVYSYIYINSYFEKFKPKMIFGSKNIFPCSWIC